MGLYEINKSSSAIAIGRDGLGRGLNFDGCVDELRISNTIIHSSMFNVPYTSDDNTVLLFDFDEESGTVVEDKSNNNIDAVFQTSTMRTDGKYKNSVRLNSTNYYSVSDRDDLDITTPLTVEGWLKWDGTKWNERSVSFHEKRRIWNLCKQRYTNNKRICSL